MSWRAARKLIRRDSAGIGSPLNGGDMSLEGADPELCITLLERGLNYSGLRRRILQADQPWMEEFLASGGLTAIFDSLDALGKRGFTSIADALRQLDCVGCVKAIMNNRFGLEFIIHTPEQNFVRKLAQGEVTVCRLVARCSTSKVAAQLLVWGGEWGDGHLPQDFPPMGHYVYLYLGHES